MSTIYSNKVISELNFIKPDTILNLVIIYSGDSKPQSYNEAYTFIPDPIFDRH